MLLTQSDIYTNSFIFSMFWDIWNFNMIMVLWIIWNHCFRGQSSLLTRSTTIAWSSTYAVHTLSHHLTIISSRFEPSSTLITSYTVIFPFLTGNLKLGHNFLCLASFIWSCWTFFPVKFFSRCRYKPTSTNVIVMGLVFLSAVCAAMHQQRVHG